MMFEFHFSCPDIFIYIHLPIKHFLHIQSKGKSQPSSKLHIVKSDIHINELVYMVNSQCESWNMFSIKGMRIPLISKIWEVILADRPEYGKQSNFSPTKNLDSKMKTQKRKILFLLL